MKVYREQAKKDVGKLKAQDFSGKSIDQLTELICAKQNLKVPKIKDQKEWKRIKDKVYIPYSGDDIFFKILPTPSPEDFLCEPDPYDIERIQRRIHIGRRNCLVFTDPAEEGIADELKYVMEQLKSYLRIHEKKYKKFFDELKTMVKQDLEARKRQI